MIIPTILQKIQNTRISKFPVVSSGGYTTWSNLGISPRANPHQTSFHNGFIIDRDLKKRNNKPEISRTEFTPKIEKTLSLIRLFEKGLKIRIT